MSAHHGQIDHQFSSIPAAADNNDEFYDTYSTLVFPSSTELAMPENLCLWQDTDGVYHWASAPIARSDNLVGYTPHMYHLSASSSDLVLSLDDHAHRKNIPEDIPPPVIAQENAPHQYTSHPTQQGKTGCSRQNLPLSQDHRSSIARASDHFLSHASTLFSDAHVVPRRESTLDYAPATQYQSSPYRGTHAPSRKRSIEALEGGNSGVKEEDNSAHSSLSAVNDTCYLPQPHMIVPSQSIAPPYRTSHRNDNSTSLSVATRSREYGLSLLRYDDSRPISTPKHFSNKRVNRTSEDLIRQENTIMSTAATWPSPDDLIMKSVKKGGEQKKQALACLFCRERKIACGRPSAHSPDQTCNQCARRRIKCEYPTESRRGQHKRRRKPVDGEPSVQEASRTNSTSSNMSTNPSLPAPSTCVTSSA